MLGVFPAHEYKLRPVVRDGCKALIKLPEMDFVVSDNVRKL